MTKKKSPAPNKPSKSTPDNKVFSLRRYFTNGTHPFKTVQWERRDALIEGMDGKPVFEQRDVSFPADWSQNATNIVAQKYFAGQLGSENREWSVKQLIGRVVEKIGSEGMKNGYFRDEEEQEIFEHELAHILVHQMAAFNSPVWFNIGVDGVAQQASACFILHVEDHLKDITRWYSEEALIFQNGSGAGLNLSNLRGSDEPLSRGGKSSGPVTFMRAADSSAGTITSGGRCLAPDQLVYTQDGPKTVQTLAQAGEDFQVYSWDAETDTLVLRTARAWRQEERKTLVYLKAAVYDEHLSAGGQGEFVTSLDHPYRLCTGEYIQAMDLEPGMELSAGMLEAQDGPVSAVARVESISHGTECEVYDIEVDCDGPDDKSPASGHNFLIWSGDDQQGVGVIVSNTRRAAKMVILDIDHPDVEDFIWCKAHEEKKARALAAAGFDMSLNTPEGEKNWASIQYQNANNSVRLTDSFLDAVEKDGDWQLVARSTGEPVKTVKARELLQQIADAAWECADPGVQYDTTINSWHTCPNHSRINGSNPCCFTGDTLVDTAEGKIRIDELVGRSENGEELPLVFSWDLETRLPVLRQIVKGWKAGDAKQLVEVTTDKGIKVRCTPEHRFLLHNGTYKQASDLQPGDRLRKVGRFVNQQRSGRHYINHRITEYASNGTSNQARWMWREVNGGIPENHDVHHVNGDPTDDRLSNLAVSETISHKSAHSVGSANPRYIELEPEMFVEIYEEIESTPVKGKLMPVTPARWNNHISREDLVGAVPMAQSPTTGGRIQGKTWDEFCAWVEEHRTLVNDRVVSVITLDTEPVAVYDLEVEGTNNFAVCSEDPVHSIVVHNSEYMHVDNSSCNLASLNLMKFRQEDGTFDVDAFRHAVQVVFLAQEILISFADYPTESIGDNTRAMRQIGMGFANLGAYLMANGLPYDSEEGRQVAGAISALMHCEAYAQSARIAERVGTYAEYKNNQDAQLRVLKRHRTAANKLDAWEGDLDLTRAAKRTAREMVELGEQFGVRNSQATVSAPTGTISFLMDCDTTGIEPDFSLLKYKKLVGGGSMTIVNQTVPQALARLGYDPQQVSEIVEYIRENNSVVDAPHFGEEYYPIFDTAIGQRSIHFMGHLKMMAAIQPFMSGAISKCVVGDTLLATENGLIRIESLYQGENEDTFRPEALRVASRGGEMTTDAFYYGGERPVRELELRSGHKIKGTYVHKVLVANPEEGLIWKELLDIEKGDYVAQSIGSEIWSKESADLSGFIATPSYGSQKKVRTPKRMTRELAQLLGIIAAEGSVVKSTWTISVANSDQGVLELTQGLWNDVFGIKARIAKHEGKCPAVVASSKEVVEFIEWLGLGNISHAKRIPDSVLTSKRSHVLAFLQGLALDAYTHQSDVNPNGKWAICLNSPKLLDDLQVVLNNLGIRSSRITKHNKEYKQDFWEVNVSGSHARRMLKLVPFLEEHKNLRAQAILDSDIQGFDGHDVIPCIKPIDLWELLPEKVAVGKGSAKSLNKAFAKEFHTLRDPRTKHVTRYMLAKLASKPGVVLTDELQEVLDDNLFFSPVQDIRDGDSAEVYDISVPGNHAFVANGIVNHNTVNLPSDISKEDIFNVYLEGWRMGLKAIAIYRDGTKTAQPLGDGKEDEENLVTSLLGDGLLRGQRRRVPDDGQAIKRRFEITSAQSGNVSGHIVVGLFEDGTPGELFVNVSQAGSTLRGFIDTWARLFSMALQYGAPLEDLIAKQVFTQFEPAGFTNDREIARAKSIPDYVVRWMAARFLDPDYHAMLGINTPEIVEGEVELAEAQKVQPRVHVKKATGSNSPKVVAAKPEITMAGMGTCAKCGGLMVQTGKCMTCTDCGETGGCG